MPIKIHQIGSSLYHLEVSLLVANQHLGALLLHPSFLGARQLIHISILSCQLLG